VSAASRSDGETNDNIDASSEPSSANLAQMSSRWAIAARAAWHGRGRAQLLVPEMAADGHGRAVRRGRILCRKAGPRIRAQIPGHNVAQDATVLTVGTVALGPKFVALFLGLVSGPDIGPAGAHNAAPEHSTGHGPTLSVSHCSAYEPVREKGVCPSRSAKAHNAGTHCCGVSPSPKPPSLV